MNIQKCLATCGLLASCFFGLQATANTGNAEIDPRIGEEVNRICFRPNINGWRTIDDLDDVVLLQRWVNTWYYVELLGACPNRVLRSAIQIGIDSRPGPSCIAPGDMIIVRDTPGLARRCKIQRIYEWNDDAQAT